MKTISCSLLLAAALCANAFAETFYCADMPRIEQAETLALPFPSPDLKAALGEGWRLPDSSLLFVDNESYRATSIDASLTLRLFHQRDLVLFLTLQPRYVKEFGQQWVDVLFNGNRVGRCEFDPAKGWAAHTFACNLPANAQRDGDNSLRLLSRYAISSKELNPQKENEDSRRMAFGLNNIRLCPPGATTPDPTPSNILQTEGNTLIQAPATSVATPFLTAADHPGKILCDGLEGEGKAFLIWDTLQGPAQRPLDLSPAPFAIDLDCCAGAFAKLVLKSAPAAPLRWKNLRFESPQPQNAPAAIRPPRKKNDSARQVIVICLDALRADALGLTGAQRDVTPFLDSLAQQSILYENACSQASWTYPSTVSLLTGHPSTEHGVVYINNFLPPAIPLIGEALQKNGVKTACVAENPFFDERYKLNRGFDQYTYIYPEQAQGETRSSQKVTQAALDFLGQHKGSPFFLYLHYFPPHAPYAKANPFFQHFTLDPIERIQPDDIPMHTVEIGDAPLSREGVAQLRARYDENVRYIDQQVQSLFEGMKAIGLGEATTVIILSDHGESFADKGPFLGHSDPPYEALIRIPFILTNATGKTERPEKRREFIRSIDVFPTVYDLLNTPTPQNMPGLTLFTTHPTPLETVLNYAQSQSADPIESFTFERYKLLLDTAGTKTEVYDLKLDPTEQANLAPFRPALTTYLKAQALAWKKQHPQIQSAPAKTERLDADAENELRALGYL